MSRTSKVAIALGLLLGMAGWSIQAQEEARAKRSEFMRLKLDYAKNVLEGLATENLTKVAKNAKDLKMMSAAALWEVPTIPKLEYGRYTSEFQRVADELAKQAEAKNLDAATLAYVQLTMNCVNCHKYVRTVDR
jgi:cytochrome c556